MKKNILNLYEGFFDDLDQLNKKNDGFGDVNANIYDQHDYILSPDKNPEFFYGLCKMIKYPKTHYNKKGFTQEDLDKIIEIYINYKGVSFFENVTSLDELQYFHNLEKISGGNGCESFNEGNPDLKSVIFPKNLKIIECDAFGGTNIEELILPDNLMTIVRGAFWYMPKLKKVVFPKNLKQINDSEVFSNDTALEEIIFNNHLRKIGKLTFGGCTSLKILNIPPSVIQINKFAFAGCTSLKEITIPREFSFKMKNIFYGVDLSKVNITYI